MTSLLVAMEGEDEVACDPSTVFAISRLRNAASNESFACTDVLTRGLTMNRVEALPEAGDYVDEAMAALGVLAWLFEESLHVAITSELVPSVPEK